ncbi:50S ribosomal protein L16 3-hydroxylase [Pseudomonas sp. JUb42]|jgi:50S ribosomal protein L16 3-hydroxylase|uniref:ribosomal protein uL16 3-hydroxylase n=1 Tax=Pseudomonas sp. JUb42 TaxID=2940611 RepID=UPI002168210C|nr:cupin domain-containing protein [Pseudomonas sp. JUb42]MCS3470776.1 50S ribosomal protein L16 3-hydroxylase [Pseudomonas sp. JUb42]
MNPDIPLQLLGGISARVFLRDYWQKKPLLIRQAIPDFQSPIDPDELAGLALEEEVESRLVLEHGERPWEMRRGPFAEDAFSELPERDWTLLVQSVDQFVPEVAELLENFRFLPSWRIDDIMISYAAPGGSVGPHFDNYDVFLLQGHGKRHWKVGQMCDSQSQLIEHADLRILAEFQDSEEWTLEPGDMLYLPPRLAHWGVAVDECVTYSVGFRAPSAAEVLTHFTDFLSQFLPDEDRYSDADAQPVSDPHQIQHDALDRLKGLLAEHMSDERLLLTWFGQFMTEPRYPELVAGAEDLQEEDLLGSLEQGAILIRNPSARLAWSEVDDDLLLFASGQSRLLPGHLRELLKLICAADALHSENLEQWLIDEEGRNLLCELVKQGSLGFADE